MRNNPDYYNINGEDTIKTIIEIVDNNHLGTEQSIYLFNTLKYLVRFNNKNRIDDLIKAKDYLERLMDVYGKDEDKMSEELVNIKNAIDTLKVNLEEDLKKVRNGLGYSSKSDFENLKELVLDWAKDKDLLHEENADKQFMKFMEEIFEFRDEWTLYIDEFNFNDCEYGEIDDDSYLCELADNMEDEMGDIFVTLIILCEQLDMDPVTCLKSAYEKISKRKGKTVNGTFIKEEDLEDWVWDYWYCITATLKTSGGIAI